MILSEPGALIEYLTFPESGMVSLLAVMQDGRTIATASIGRDGVLGGFGSLGLRSFPGRSVVHLPGIALRVPASKIVRLARHYPAIREMLIDYVERLLGQLFVLSACNSLHPIELRLSRWLLQAREKVGSEIIPITQELLSEVLGVRRASITEAAGNLEAMGLIRRNRGYIEIVNHAELAASACECRLY